HRPRRGDPRDQAGGCPVAGAPWSASVVRPTDPPGRAPRPWADGRFAVVHPMAARRGPVITSRHVTRHEPGRLGGRPTRCPQTATGLAPPLAAARPGPPARSPAAARGAGQAGSAARRVKGADTAGPAR